MLVFKPHFKSFICSIYECNIFFCFVCLGYYNVIFIHWNFHFLFDLIWFEWFIYFLLFKNSIYFNQRFFPIGFLVNNPTKFICHNKCKNNNNKIEIEKIISNFLDPMTSMIKYFISKRLLNLYDFSFFFFFVQINKYKKTMNERKE